MGEAAPLSRIFLARLGGRNVGDLPGESLEQTLQALVAAGSAAWPLLQLEPETFVAHIADRAGAQRDVQAALPGLRAADFFLACACSHGIPAALAAFEQLHLARVRGFVARIDSAA